MNLAPLFLFQLYSYVEAMSLLFPDDIKIEFVV